MTAFTLAHLSDVHLPPLPAVRAHQLANKRVLGYLNWKKNRHAIHRREVLDAVVADMLAHGPDQIAVTGDLVNLSLEQEFSPVAAWLAEVGPPERVTVVPGNHDAYVRSAQHRFAETHCIRICTAMTPLARGGISVPAPTRPGGVDRIVERGADARRCWRGGQLGGRSTRAAGAVAVRSRPREPVSGAC